MEKNWRSSCSPVRVSRIAFILAGLVACAAPARNAESRPLRPEAGGYQVEVLLDGTPAQSFWHEGETFVLGHLGDRALLGGLADQFGIETMYRACAFLPAIGLLAWFLPRLRHT